MESSPGGRRTPRAGHETEDLTASGVYGEARWPMAVAVIAAIFLATLLPDDLRVGPNWGLPIVEGVLLVVIITGDPGRITRRARWLRVAAIVLVSFLVAHTLAATGLLINQLITGGTVTDSAEDLLTAGTSVWALNTIAFGLFYWEIDGGGAAARAEHLGPHPDIAFPQQLTPEIAAEDWRPNFVDYLYLGLTNSLAFSPTDAMPLAPWAKVSMGLQSLISLAILGLVVARAVNVFS